MNVRGSVRLLLLASLFLATGLTSIFAADAPKEKPPRFKIAHDTFLGSIWSPAQAKASVVSQDGGQSFAVPGGAIWAFGDTFKGSRNTDGSPHFEGGAVSCSIAFLKTGAQNYPPPLQYLTGTNGVVSPFDYLPEESGGNYRIWPGGGIQVGGHFYLYYSLIHIFGVGTWDFRGEGSGLARSDTALGHYERLRPGGDWRFPVDVSQALEADGWVYLFGIGDLRGEHGVELARVRREKMEDPHAYEFYVGGDQFWPQKEAARILVNDIPGQVSVAWNGFLKKYVMATSSDFSAPRQIQFRLAEKPWGPWSDPVGSVKAPAKRQGKKLNLVYCSYLHPELFRDDGRIMFLTFSVGLEKAGFDGNCEMVEIELRPK